MAGPTKAPLVKGKEPPKKESAAGGKEIAKKGSPKKEPLAKGQELPKKGAEGPKEGTSSVKGAAVDGRKPPAKQPQKKKIEEAMTDLIISPANSAGTSPEAPRRRLSRASGGRTSPMDSRPTLSQVAQTIFSNLGKHRRLAITDEETLLAGIKTLEADSRHGRKMIQRNFTSSEQLNGKIKILQEQLAEKDKEISKLQRESAKKSKEIEGLQEALVDRGRENTQLQGQQEEIAERLRAKASQADVIFGCSGRAEADMKAVQIADEVASASRSVAVCCYALSDPIFIAALCQAGSRGAQVRVVVDVGWLQDISGAGNARLDGIAAFARTRKLLRAASVHVAGQRGQKKKGKHKVTYEAFDSNCVCVDGATLIVGSHRFSEEGPPTDHSFAIIRHTEEAGPGIAHFGTIFERLWEASTKPPA